MATPTVYTPKPLIAPQQLTNSNATYYTVPASTVTKLVMIVLVNDTTTAVTVTINIVPTGGSADDTNILMKTVSIPTDGFPVILILDEFYMAAATTIQAVASVTAQVTIHISGVELS